MVYIWLLLQVATVFVEDLRMVLLQITAEQGWSKHSVASNILHADASETFQSVPSNTATGPTLQTHFHLTVRNTYNFTLLILGCNSWGLSQIPQHSTGSKLIHMT